MLPIYLTFWYPAFSLHAVNPLEGSKAKLVRDTSVLQEVSFGVQRWAELLPCGSGPFSIVPSLSISGHNKWETEQLLPKKGLFGPFICPWKAPGTHLMQCYECISSFGKIYGVLFHLELWQQKVKAAKVWGLHSCCFLPALGVCSGWTPYA